MVITRLLTSGGAERVAANLAAQLGGNGDEAWLVVFDGNNATYSTDASIIDLKLPMKNNPIKKAIWYFKVFMRVRKLKRELGITHSISFLNEPDLINVLTPCGAKTIVSVRNNRSSLNKNALTKWKDKLVFRAADRIVSLSQGAKEDLIDFYAVEADKIDVIYNTCDRALIARQYETVPDDAAMDGQIVSGKTVITAGRLTTQKGQWHLIRAFSEVVKAIPDAKLLILGQGSMAQYLSELIERMGLGDSVHLMGYHKNPYYYLKKADLFVFSSLFEGFGNILLEAMACGLPIVSTDCMVGPRELLAPGTAYSERTKESVIEAENGILVPVCDGRCYTATDAITAEEKLLAEAIVRMLTQDDLRRHYCERSAERIKDFSAEKITDEWRSLIDRL